MAITTFDGVIAGCKPPQFLYKAPAGINAAGKTYSAFYAAGVPGAAAAPTPGLSGVALTSYPGQIPFTNPTAGQLSYLARFVCSLSASSGQVMLLDRLWHNSGISSFSNSVQTINSVAFPARDQNGTSDGVGVLLALEVTNTPGTGNPTITVTYTNSDGVGSRTGQNIIGTGSVSVQTEFHQIRLEAGDKGVRSVQSIQFTGSWGGGTMNLVAYRILSVNQVGNGGIATANDVTTNGMVQLFDNTVPFITFAVAGTTTIQGVMTVTQG